MVLPAKGSSSTSQPFFSNFERQSWFSAERELPKTAVLGYVLAWLLGRRLRDVLFYSGFSFSSKSRLKYDANVIHIIFSRAINKFAGIQDGSGFHLWLSAFPQCCLSDIRAREERGIDDERSRPKLRLDGSSWSFKNFGDLQHCQCSSGLPVSSQITTIRRVTLLSTSHSREYCRW